MSDTLAMKVRMKFAHPNYMGWVYGAPPAKARAVIEVPFSVGARLVASGYAEAYEEKEKPPRKE